MDTVIRNACIAFAMGFLHRYLSGPGTWIPHHLALDVVASVAGVCIGVFALVQLFWHVLALVSDVLRGEFR